MKLKDRESTLELMERLGLEESVLEVVRRCGLRWTCHILRREDEDPIKMVWELDESVARGRGRPKITWKDNLKREARKRGLREEDVQDQVKWRRMTWMNGNSNLSQDGNNAV